MWDETLCKEALRLAGLPPHISLRLVHPPLAVKGVEVGQKLSELQSQTEARSIELFLAPGLLDRWMQHPESLSPERLASRWALADVWEEALAADSRQLGLSLSHSHRCSAAAACASESIDAWVGIDIEHRDRETDSRLAARLRHVDDFCSELPTLALWTAKEAALKSDGKAQGAILSQYAVQGQFVGDDVWSGRVRRGNIQRDVAIALGDVIVAVAFCGSR